MDPVTHGLIGASSSASITKDDKLRVAALIGAAGAMLPDLDIFIDSAADPLLQLEYHRTITHSLVFIPFGALLVSGILWWFFKNRLSFKEMYFYSLLGISTAGITDICTSYGVQYLWPFMDIRFDWNLISVFDPLFSLGLIIALGWALYQKTQKTARIGIAWVLLYLLFGFIQQQKVKTIAQNLADERGHEIEQLIIKPTIANEVLWSIRYVSGDSLYADGVWTFPFADSKIYNGNSSKLLEWQQKYDRYQGTTLYADIARFSKLSDGILVTHPSQNQVIGDGRYAMLPTSLEPLWGIKVDTTQADHHVEFETYRDTGKEIRSRFLEMLLGN